MALLDEALAALRAGREAPALTSLLEAWRQSREPRLAGAIELLSARLDEGLPPLGPLDSAARCQAWLELARADEPAHWGRLLEALAATAPLRLESDVERQRLYRRCVAELERLPDDPRAASALVRVAAYLDSGELFYRDQVGHVAGPFAPEEPPTARAPSVGESLGRLLVQHLDPRALDWLAGFRSWMTEVDCNGAALLGVVAEAVRAGRARLEALAPAQVDAALLDKLEQALAALPARPSAPERAELIRLQQLGGNGAAEQALIDAGWESWLGSAAMAIAPGSARFDCGRLVGVRLRPGGRLMNGRYGPEPIRSPELATLRELEVAGFIHPDVLDLLPTLRVLEGIDDWCLGALLDRAVPPPIEALACAAPALYADSGDGPGVPLEVYEDDSPAEASFSFADEDEALVLMASEGALLDEAPPELPPLEDSALQPWERDLASLLKRGQALPALRRLHLASPGAPEALRWFWTTRQGRQLRRFGAALEGPASLAAWLREAPHLPPELETLTLREDRAPTLRPSGWCFELRLSTRALHVANAGSSGLDYLEAALASLAPGQLSRLRVSGLTPAERESIASLAARLVPAGALELDG